MLESYWEKGKTNPCNIIEIVILAKFYSELTACGRYFQTLFLFASL